jgi:hypothetical protein
MRRGERWRRCQVPLSQRIRKTDVINKVLQLYNEVRAAQEADGGIWIQADKGSEAAKLRPY